MKLQLNISNNGLIKAVYSDQLLPLLEDAEAVSIERASHVEPQGKEWTSDLSPVSGPLLGPFKSRQEALDAEVSYLETEVLGFSKP